LARDSWTGAAANAFGVKTAAAEAPPGATMSPKSGRPEALIPAVEPPVLKPFGSTARRSTTGNGGDESVETAIYGASGSCSRPAVSGRPWTTLNAWTA
jgi:hypothetical protein